MLRVIYSVYMYIYGVTWHHRMLTQIYVIYVHVLYYRVVHM